MLAGANFILWPMTGTELSLKQSLKVPAGESVPWFVVSDLRFCMCNVGPHPGGLVRDPWGCMMQVVCSEEDMENSPPQVKSHIIQAMNIHTHIHMGHYTALYWSVDLLGTYSCMHTDILYPLKYTVQSDPYIHFHRLFVVWGYGELLFNPTANRKDPGQVTSSSQSHIWLNKIHNHVLYIHTYRAKFQLT